MGSTIIKGRKPGSNITIMNTLFWRGPDEEGKFREYLTMIYKDLDTGMKHFQEVIDPDYEYYIAKEEYRTDYSRLFIEEAKTDKITVPHKDLEKDIAERTGNKQFFYDNARSGNRAANKKLHTHPDIFNSDMNIEDHYMLRFSRMYKNEPCTITKAFFDIEADTISMMGDFPEPGECPINAISLILQERKKVYVFLLRNKNNPLIEEFEKEVNTGSVHGELSEFVIKNVGGYDTAKKYGIHDFNYAFLFYDEDKEINLIHDLFVAINNFKPDFALAWNMGFDIPYILARIARLGYDPRDIVCNPDFTNKVATYYIDERNKSDFAERGDFAQISSYTVFLDQMIHFASRRKGQSKFISFTLDYIGEAVAKVRKLNYKHITTNISELPYKDYKTFVFYNVMDTVVQYCIEAVTGDIDYVFTKSNINCTRYCKAHRQTVYLTNRVTKDIMISGNFVIGNNCNKFNPKPDVKFPGAFVADPLLLSNFPKMMVRGIYLDCCENAIDLDYASLYPSIIREFNIAPNTQIGLVYIDKVFSPIESARSNNTVSGAFMEDIQSQVWLEIGSRWFNLATYTELYHEVEEFFKTVMNPTNGLKLYERDGYIDPFVYVDPNLMNTPIGFNFTPRIEDRYVEHDDIKWKGWRENAIANPNQQF